MRRVGHQRRPLLIIDLDAAQPRIWVVVSTPPSADLGSLRLIAGLASAQGPVNENNDRCNVLEKQGETTPPEKRERGEEGCRQTTLRIEDR